MSRRLAHGPVVRRPAAKKPSSDLAAQVGEELTRARNGRGRPQMAAILGWKTDMPLFHLEHGRANPTLAHVEKVAAAYGGHLEVIFVSDHPSDGDDG